MSKRKLNSSQFFYDNGFVYGWYEVELSLVAFFCARRMVNNAF